MESFTEAEIQVLITLVELAQPIETPNNTHYTFSPKTQEEAAAYFYGLQEEWGPAFQKLQANGLVQPVRNEWELTSAGLQHAVRLRLARPPIYYWYRKFYSIAPHSPAYAAFCEQLYGRNLCQAGFSDMEQIDKILEVTQLTKNSRALDLGCGTGDVAGYLAKRSGAHFTGVDYTPEAIQFALVRTQSRREILDFLLGNLDTLTFPDGGFDLILSIDSLYMPNDLPVTLHKIMDMLRPKGELVVLCGNMLWGSDNDRSILLPENYPLAKTLSAMGIQYRTWDFSEQDHIMMQRKHRLAEVMRPDFDAECTQMLSNFLIAESESSQEPYDPLTARRSRFLFHIQK